MKTIKHKNTGCDGCPFNYDDSSCNAADRYFMGEVSPGNNDKSPDWCPLPVIVERIGGEEK